MFVAQGVFESDGNCIFAFSKDGNYTTSCRMRAVKRFSSRRRFSVSVFMTLLSLSRHFTAMEFLEKRKLRRISIMPKDCNDINIILCRLCLLIDKSYSCFGYGRKLTDPSVDTS